MGSDRSMDPEASPSPRRKRGRADTTAATRAMAGSNFLSASRSLPVETKTPAKRFPERAERAAPPTSSHGPCSDSTETLAAMVVPVRSRRIQIFGAEALRVIEAGGLRTALSASRLRNWKVDDGR